jgi:hypothetical protein
VVLFALYGLAVRAAARRGDSGVFVIIFIASLLFRGVLFLGPGLDAPAADVFLYGRSPLTVLAGTLGIGVLVERAIAAACDLGALALAPGLLKAARLPVGAAVIHGFNPLVVTEVAGRGRLEVVALVLLLVSLRLIQNDARWPGAIVYGASLGGPLSLAAALPLVAKAVRARIVLALGIALLAWSLALSQASFAERAGWPPDDAVGGSLTPALVAIANLFLTRNDGLVVGLLFAAWAVFALVRAARLRDDARLPQEALLALGSLVAISPQVLPWAFVAIAYLAAYSSNRGWIAFTATAPMIYLADGEWSFWLGFAQYFVPYALTIFWWLGRPPHEAAGNHKAKT